MKFSILKIFEFDSDRKMFSAIIKDESTGKTICFTKGADSSVAPLCYEDHAAKKYSDADSLTMNDLDKMAA